MKKASRLPKSKTKSRPKNVWNSLRKLESCIRKADIQATVCLNSLSELRDEMALEVRSEIVRSMGNTVNGDILHALLEHKRTVAMGNDSGNIEQNAIMLGIFEALERVLNLTPFMVVGERFDLCMETAKNYDFDEYPESLYNGDAKKIGVEVLRCGWKVGSRIVIKPKVFEVRSDILVASAIDN